MACQLFIPLCVLQDFKLFICALCGDSGRVSLSLDNRSFETVTFNTQVYLVFEHFN